MAKMTKIEKGERKEFLAEIRAAGGDVFTFGDSRVTVAIVPGIPNSERVRTVQAAVAICSEGDKFKRKRGELIAADRLLMGQSVPMQVGDADSFYDLAQEMAFTVSR